VQALSARVYSFTGLLIPQALMGVASVALVYDLVRRWGRVGSFGQRRAARRRSPSRSRATTTRRAARAVRRVPPVGAVRRLEDGRTRWLVWAGVGVGSGSGKMGAALLVVPGIVAAWLWVAPRAAPRRCARQLVHRRDGRGRRASRC
jgi:4-amino-4-deoxy-L-arabinose transferase-like glycosyltransferase